MPDVEVHIDLEGTPRLVGLLRRHVARRTDLGDGRNCGSYSKRNMRCIACGVARRDFLSTEKAAPMVQAPRR
jgi:hypothetical protein